MKNKGFTLIELLAVIVILAIIAIIATPVVLNIIKSSKGSSIERSAELYLDQVKNEIARYNMTHPSSNFNPSECTVQSDDSLICNGTSLKVEVNGDKPDSGSKILLSNGSITGLKDFKISGKSLKYISGKITQSICEGVAIKTTGNVPHGKYVVGDEYICDVGDGENKRFFVLENNTETVSLIMYANVGADGKAVTSSSTDPSIVAWVTKADYKAAGGTESDWGKDGNNNKGPLTANRLLKKYTSIWTNISSSQITLPSVEQIKFAVGEEANKLVDTSYGGVKSVGWLFGYTSLYYEFGYWTTTPEAYLSYQAYAVRSSFLHNKGVGDCCIGVRPVITIPKSMIG